MRLFTNKKATAVVVGGVFLVASGGAAYAYWTTSGSGTGSASTGTTSAVGVVQDSTPTGMYPGGPAGSLNGHFTSTNASNVNIGSVTAVVSSVTNGSADSSKPSCVPADYVISGASGSYTVPTGTSTPWTGLTIALTNSAFNQDNCKSATAIITYTATPAA